MEIMDLTFFVYFILLDFITIIYGTIYNSIIKFNKNNIVFLVIIHMVPYYVIV